MTFTEKEMIKEIKERIGSLDVRDNIERRAYEIALASLEAKPVAWTDDEELRDVERIGIGYLLPYPPDKYADQRRVIPLYREHPAQTVSNDRGEQLEEFVWTGEGWRVPLIGSEPEDDVPESFFAYISARSSDDMDICISVPPYMIIPYIEGEQDEELFNTCAGALRVSFLELLKEYTSSCIREDAGDGVLYMADFFERMSKSLRKFYGTLPQEKVAAAKVDVDLVIPWEQGGHEEGDK